MFVNRKGFTAPLSAAAVVLLSLLAAAMPLSFSSHLPGRTFPAAALFVWGLALWLTDAGARKACRIARPVLLPGWILTAFIIANVVVHHEGWRPLDHAAHVLLFLVIAPVFSRLRMRLVWAGFAATAIVLGGVCVVQHFALAIPRAYGLNGGASASIQLATVLLGLGLLSLIRLLANTASLPEKWFHALALALAVFGALLTQSRGPLLGFIPMAGLLLWWHARRHGRWQTAAMTAVVLVAGLLLATVALRGVMVDRLEAAQQEVASFDAHHQTRGAVGERLEMWRTALRAAAEHPLLGIGPEHYNDYVRDEIEAGRSSRTIAMFNQPHNEYLRAAVSGGVPGLLALLLMLAWPLVFFLRQAGSANDRVALPAMAGAALTGLYIICALTDSVFYRVMSQSFFFFLAFGLAVLIGRELSGTATTDAAEPASAAPAPVD